MGSVYEPFLSLTPHIHLFFGALFQGYTFAEAAYMSQPVLSWTITVVGDPLYTPFPQSADKLLEAQTQNAEWLTMRRIRKQIEAGRIKGDDMNFESAFPQAGSSWVGYEGFGDVSGNLKSAAKAYHKALELSSEAVDQIRIGQKLIRNYEQQRELKLAYPIMEELLTRWPTEAVFYGVAAEVKRIGGQQDAPPLPVSLLRYLTKQ
jgi:hypothetical protein